jgi:hypothetical protein
VPLDAKQLADPRWNHLIRQNTPAHLIHLNFRDEAFDFCEMLVGELKRGCDLSN